RMPEAGADFLGFHLLSQLGRGAFGRVFLARQPALAGRLVVLKVSTDLMDEPQRLAQLQHANIVPVYSVHQAYSFHAICMPYVGSTTLADVVRDLGAGASLPASGKMLVSTVKTRQCITRQSQSSAGAFPFRGPDQPPPKDPEQTDAGRTEEKGSAVFLQRLEAMTYVQAILWIGARLADGLAHAHAQGILHRDLKPANILLTDQGQPMLLDFNLSEDVKRRVTDAAGLVGGTLPYTAPNTLHFFRGASSRFDARPVVFSLGFILFELLTGRPPFPAPPDPSGNMLPRVLEDRPHPPPRFRRGRKAISPAVE